MKNNFYFYINYIHKDIKNIIPYSLIYKCGVLILKKNSKICIFNVNKKKIKKLNFQYRGKNSITNILTFIYNKKKNIKADIILCKKKIIQEAKEQNKTLLSHLIHLIIHGMLHIKGFNHNNKKSSKKMEKKEIKILKKLGFKNPYIVYV